jgi:hypothetical protein
LCISLAIRAKRDYSALKTNGNSMRYTDLATRHSAHYDRTHAPNQTASFQRQSFHRPHTSLGVAGHWLHLGMAAAPLFIAKYIPDPETKWRVMTMVPIAGAVASDFLWSLKISHEREREEETRAALEACGGHHR